MKLGQMLYDLGTAAASRLLRYLPFLPDKARRSIEGRRGLVERIGSWSKSARIDAPLVWFHAPSVGEGLQTRPVIQALRDARPDVQVLYTYFSPSAEKLARTMPADYCDYMPFDVVRDLRRVLDEVEPSAIVFGKLDVWPALTRLAYWRGVKLALVSATLAPNSSRLRWPARRLLAEAYGRLDAVGAISREDAARLARLGARRDRIAVTGDARFDQVWERARSVDRTAAPLAALAGFEGPTLVAGSTWPEDESHLVPALANARRRFGGLRGIIAPHEPTPEHLARLEAGLEAVGLGHSRLSAVESGSQVARGIVVVDRVGVLGVLYALADVAYVGGGFGTRGLHSVLEPAAFGAPVLFGPRHANAREATELIDAGGAVSVDGRAAIEGALARWLDRPGERASASAAALGYVEGHLGASRRNAELVLALLDDGGDEDPGASRRR